MTQVPIQGDGNGWRREYYFDKILRFVIKRSKVDILWKT